MHILKRIQNNVLLLIIVSAGFFCRVYAALLDPFLHDWDERYHALVARNMMKFPFKPMLNRTVMTDYGVNDWCCNHIWLHKQPLFLWQIAGFMKLFGVSTFTLRLPSVIMGSLMVLIIYKITINTTRNKVVSLIAAIFMCFSFYQLNLISGRKGMDHNDVAFGFYILCSLWAFTEYLQNPKLLKWVLLTGLFAGCAVLTKWLTGILVFAPWGLLAIFDFYKTKKLSAFKNIGISFTVCLLVFLPWQLYIFYKFPVQALHEYQYNSQHIFNAVEGHKGDVFYYIKDFDTYFGKNIFIFLIIGFVATVVQKNRQSQLHFSLAFSFVLVLFFFSCIAQTKIDSYFFIVVPLGFIYAAIGIEFLLSKMKLKGNIVLIIALVIIFFASNPYRLVTESSRILQRTERIHNDSIYRNLKKLIPKDIKIVTNAYAPGHNDIMFYHDDISASSYWIEEKYLQICAQNKIKIAAFADHAQNKNFAFTKDYPYIYIIPVTLR